MTQLFMISLFPYYVYFYLYLSRLNYNYLFDQNPLGLISKIKQNSSEWIFLLFY